METLLLIGPESPEQRRLKSTLLKRGYQVKVISAQELECLCDPERPRSGRGSGFASSSESHEREARFVLGLVEPAKSERLAELVRQVRANRACRELPLIALIREAQVRELGASVRLEDFLVLPAEPETIEVRVRFVLSRLNHLVPGAGKRFGALEIHADRYEVRLNGEPLELTYKEFELLKFLATHPGRVFSRDQLLNQVWGYNFIGGTRTVDVHIRRLRAKLGPKVASLVDTVRNVGYKFLEDL